MLCSKPVSVGTAGPFGCGQCHACRINRRREWTARLLLHHAGHAGASAFLTLTYGPEEVPRAEDGNAVLRAGDMRDFVQRLRRAVGPLRYVYVGEYGERTMRPHFHVLLWCGMRYVAECVYGDCWRRGFVHVGEIAEASIAYTIGYLLKRMTRGDDARLGGRPPEFGRYSKGLGLDCLPELRRCAQLDRVTGTFWLPREYRLGGKVWPMPRYLRQKLEKEGYVFKKSKDEVAEREFVSRLRGVAGRIAADSVVEFRRENASVVNARRARSVARLKLNIGKVKYETL